MKVKSESRNYEGVIKAKVVNKFPANFLISLLQASLI